MTKETRTRLEARANAVGLTITGSKGDWYLDRLDTDYLDRRGKGFRDEAQVEEALAEMEHLDKLADA